MKEYQKILHLQEDISEKIERTLIIKIVFFQKKIECVRIRFFAEKNRVLFAINTFLKEVLHSDDNTI